MTLRARIHPLRERGRTILRENRPLLGNAASMVATAVVTSLLGAAFWIVATHYFSTSSVGLASASISAMTLLGFMATVGLGTMLMGELPRIKKGHHSVIDAALLTSGSIGTVLGLAFAFIAPAVSSNFDPLRESWITIGLFAAGVALTALTFVLDQALIGLLRGTLQLHRNIVFTLTKLLALVPVAGLISGAGPQWIYGTWTAGIAVSLLVLYRFYKDRPAGSLTPDFNLLSRMRLHAATHHAINLALRTPELLLPIVVVSVLSATANASFYIAYMITGFMFFVPLSLSTVLYAVSSGDSDEESNRFRLTFTVSMAFGVVSNLVLLVLGTPLLKLFGASYATEASKTLHILALDIFPSTVLTHFVALRRTERRLGSALPVIWGGALLQVGGGAIGAHLGGLTGVAIGWVAGATVEAAVMAPEVLRAVRRPGPAESPPAEDAQHEPTPVGPS